MPTEHLERRAVVALFIDISGFTSMVEEGDIEEIHESLGVVFREAAAAVARHGGTVEKYVGDALLALFGAERAHSDDVDRAIAAALEIRDHLAAAEPPFGCRAGIELGEVLVDRSRLRLERDLMAMGDSINTAARLQQIAAPGEVVVGPQAAALTRASLGQARSLTLKGKAQALNARVVLAPPAATNTLGRFALVGRAAEMDRLTTALDEVRISGKPAVLSVLGEPGIGKSRLVAEFLAHEGVRARAGRSLPEEEADQAGLLRQLLTPDLADKTTGPVDALTAAYSGRASEDDDPRHVAQLLAITAGLVDAGAQFSSLLGSRRRDQARIAWRSYLGVLAREHGDLVLLVDDAHFTGTDTRLMLAAAVAACDAPVLLLLTAWDAGQLTGWEIAGDLRPFEVGALSRESALALAEAAGVAPSVREALADNAQGNPLYIESVGIQAASSADLLPLGVRAAVTARLDALADGLKPAVAAAAVLAPTMTVEGISALCGTSALAARDHCTALADAGVFDKTEGTIGFRHQLLRASAYAVLTRKEKSRMHGLAAAHLSAVGGAPADIARHLDLAGEALEAAISYRRAAALAAGRLQFAEPLRLLARAEELLLPLDPELAAQAAVEQGHVLVALGRLADSAAAFSRSLEMMSTDTPIPRAGALSGRAVARFWQGDVAGAEADAGTAMEAAEGDDTALGEASVVLALIRSSQGRPEEATRLVDEGAALSRRSGRTTLATMAGTVAVLVHHHSGRSAAAAEMMSSVVADCRRDGLPGPMTWALYKGGLAHAAVGRYSGALAAWDEVEKVVARTENFSYLAEIANCRGHVARELGRYGEADEFDHESYELSIKYGAGESAANALLNLAAGALAADKLELAARRLQEADPYLQANEFYRWRYTQRYRNYRALLAIAADDFGTAAAMATEALALGRHAGTGKNTLRPQLLLARILGRDDPVESRRALAAIAAEAEALALLPIAWRAHGLAAADAARQGAAAESHAHAAAALRALKGIEPFVPPTARASWVSAIGARIEAEDYTPAFLPL